MKNKRKLIFATMSMTIVFIIAIVLLIAGLIKTIANNNKPYYMKKSRVENVSEYAKANPNFTTLGWIRVQGTNIDYPVIYGNGLDFNELLDDFTWTEDEEKKLTNRVFILGHNIRNVSSNPLIADKNQSRFEQLPSFTYLEFAEKNKYIQYTIDGKDYLYKIFSVSIVNDNELDHSTRDFSKTELKEYIDQSLKDSFYDFDISVDENDNIITLITCTRFYGRVNHYSFKIDARMVRDKEKIKNYSVKENSNYKKIEETMRAGEESAKAI